MSPRSLPRSNGCVSKLERSLFHEAERAIRAEAEERRVRALMKDSDLRWSREVSAREAAEAECARLREALSYLFEVWLPEEHCNGPRDCAGTQQGCSHCCPDARLEAARASLTQEANDGD